LGGSAPYILLYIFKFYFLDVRFVRGKGAYRPTPGPSGETLSARGLHTENLVHGALLACVALLESVILEILANSGRGGLERFLACFELTSWDARVWEIELSVGYNLVKKGREYCGCRLANLGQTLLW
jgi:hypothetical protein